MTPTAQLSLQTLRRPGGGSIICPRQQGQADSGNLHAYHARHPALVVPWHMVEGCGVDWQRVASMRRGVLSKWMPLSVSSPAFPTLRPLCGAKAAPMLQPPVWLHSIHPKEVNASQQHRQAGALQASARSAHPRRRPIPMACCIENNHKFSSPFVSQCARCPLRRSSVRCHVRDVS